MSIRKKMTLLIMACVLLGAVLTSYLNIRLATPVIDDYALGSMNSLCQEKAYEINNELLSMSHYVEILYNTAENLCPPDVLTNGEARQGLLQTLRYTAQNTLLSSGNIFAVYCVFNHEQAPGEGLFIARDEDGTVRDLPLTPITNYSQEDPEVSWYWRPQMAGTAVWIRAYSNINVNDEAMVSYVIPMYHDDTLICVVGMDMLQSTIMAMTSEIQIYDTGYAILSDSTGGLLWHPEYPTGLNNQDLEALFPNFQTNVLQDTTEQLIEVTWRGEQKAIACQRLVNEMTVTIVAPLSEINAPQRRMIMMTIISTLFVLTISFVLTGVVVHRITKPIVQLTQAAKAIASGSYTQKLQVKTSTNDEVKTLAESLETMSERMRYYIHKTEERALTDPLTNIGNKAAFRAAVDDYMELYPEQYGLLIMDVNCLKEINDHLGHEAGDQLLLEAVHFIENILADCPVYRFGGDEFAALLSPGKLEDARDESYAAYFMEKLKAYNAEHQPYQPWGLWIAVGYARITPGSGESFSMVFRRADAAMYENKAALKEILGQKER